MVHAGKVHLVDIRNWNAKQKLYTTPGVSPGRHISGLAFSPMVTLYITACECEMSIVPVV